MNDTGLLQNKQNVPSGDYIHHSRKETGLYAFASQISCAAEAYYYRLKPVPQRLQVVFVSVLDSPMRAQSSYSVGRLPKQQQGRPAN